MRTATSILALLALKHVEIYSSNTSRLTDSDGSRVESANPDQSRTYFITIQSIPICCQSTFIYSIEGQDTVIEWYIYAQSINQILVIIYDNVCRDCIPDTTGKVFYLDQI